MWRSTDLFRGPFRGVGSWVGPPPFRAVRVVRGPPPPPPRSFCCLVRRLSALRAPARLVLLAPPLGSGGCCSSVLLCPCSPLPGWLDRGYNLTQRTARPKRRARTPRPDAPRARPSAFILTFLSRFPPHADPGGPGPRRLRRQMIKTRHRGRMRSRRFLQQS